MALKVSIHEYDTPESLYDVLSRVFGERENNGSRWVKFSVDDLELTFFRATPPTTDESPAL